MAVHVVDDRSVVVYPLNPQDLAEAENIGGVISIEGVTTEPIAFQPSTKWNAAQADAEIDIPTPAKVSLKLFLRQSDSQTFDITIDKGTVTHVREEGRARTAEPPEITTAGLGLVVDGEETVIGVIGSSLEYGHIFLKNESTEIEVPVDVAKTTSIVVMESGMRKLFKEGEWDLVVRAPSGQSTLQKSVRIEKLNQE